jgi:transketolase
LRFGRSATPVFTTADTPFVIGKALMLFESDTPVLAILSTGSLSAKALSAAQKLSEEGIEVLVLHIATIKPLDEEAILSVAKRVGRVITLEEHQIAGGLGSAVAELLSLRSPVPVLRLGMQNCFGQSGTPDELLTHYGLDVDSVIREIKTFITKAI